MNEEHITSINMDAWDPQLVCNESNLSPSNDGFDRSPYTDAEYIELLKKEIFYLQGKLSTQENFKNQFKFSTPKPSGIIPESSEFSPAKESTRSREVEVPQRSARRNEEVQTRGHIEAPKPMLSTVMKVGQGTAADETSVTSLVSNSPFDESGSKYLSPDLRHVLSASTELTPRPKREISTGDKEGNSVSLSKTSQRNRDTPHEVLYETHEITGIPTSYAAREKKDLMSPMTSKEISPGMSLDHASPSSSSQFTPRIRQPSSKQSSTKQPTSILSNEVDHKNSSYNQAADLNSRVFPTPLTQLQQSPDEYERASAPVTPITPDFNGGYDDTSNSRSDFTREHNYMGTPNTRDTSSKSSQLNQFSARPEDHLAAFGDGINAETPSTQTEEEDDSLFIKPKDFFTIRIHVVSTISANYKNAEENNCTFSVNDKETGKEMWRVRKSYTQIVSFDSHIRQFIEFFGLPTLPDRSTFSSAIPVKVAFRSQALQRYFDTIMRMPHIPHNVLLEICRYMSVDFVNPLDDFRSGARKEGFLIRRYKGLGTTWKVRWCQIDGPALEIYDIPGGSLIEQIKLSGSQIGRQSSDVAAEDRGYRHAFLVLESSRSSKLSTHAPKHFFCAESDIERDEWIEAMVDFTENDPLTGDDRSTRITQQHHYLQPSSTQTTDDIDQSNGRPSSSNRSFDSPTSITESLSDLDSTQKPVDEQNQRQVRKTKMRHLFPFRSILGQTEDTEVALPATPAVILDEATVEPDMQSYLNRLDLSKESPRAIFGRDLSYIYTLSSHDFEGTRIPSICFRCFEFLKKTGAIYEEGIFRLSGSASAIRALRDLFNKDLDMDLFQSPLKPDIHTVAGLLKTFLRELPHSLFGETAYFEIQRIFAENSRNFSQSQISLMVKEFVQNSGQVDEAHLNLSIVVLGFLRLVIANSSTNKMSLKNVCIVFVPTLNISVDILSLCLTDFDCIFANLPPIPDHKREILDLHIPSF